MKAYIEENAWASCTFDLAGSPQQLQKESDRLVVGYVGQDRLMTIDDRATKNKFTCKLIAKQWGGLLSLIGGIAIGVTMVLSGPVGWVALGALAVVAIGTTVAVCMHDCSDPLRNGKWVRFHATVLIRDRNALLYNRSQLNCGNGGILIASETQAAAQAISDAMKWSARTEVAVQILSNALIGVIVGRGFKDRNGDLDLASPFLAVGAYYYTDFVHPNDFTPEQSLIVSLSSQGVSYGMGYSSRIPWLRFMKNFGTELGQTSDVLTTVGMIVTGYVADKVEQQLANHNNEVINAAATVAATGKTIIGAED